MPCLQNIGSSWCLEYNWSFHKLRNVYSFADWPRTKPLD